MDQILVWMLTHNVRSTCYVLDQTVSFMILWNYAEIGFGYDSQVQFEAASCSNRTFYQSYFLIAKTNVENMQALVYSRR